MGKANVKKIKFLTLILAYSVLACVVEPFAWLRGKYEYQLVDTGECHPIGATSTADLLKIRI